MRILFLLCVLFQEMPADDPPAPQVVDVVEIDENGYKKSYCPPVPQIREFLIAVPVDAKPDYTKVLSFVATYLVGLCIGRLTK